MRPTRTPASRSSPLRWSTPEQSRRAPSSRRRRRPSRRWSTTGATATAFGFKVVPNGVLVDADGVVRYANYGDFSVEQAADRSVVERFAAGEGPWREPTSHDALRSRRGRRRISWRRNCDWGGCWTARASALRRWRSGGRALRYDPENLVIRKQIWAVLHPEKFHPAIDWDWQEEQFARERAEEIAVGICGPDGCPLPDMSTRG